jgi:predicted PhzF superfamily epimerase YddE/YHI9
LGVDLKLEENVRIVPVKVTLTANGGNAVFKSPLLSEPATGSAVATLPGQLLAHEDYSDGLYELAVGQGIEMGRESRIDLAFTVTEKALSEVRIGGDAVFVQRGELLD